ncbi:MAG: M2 family metallopeptidase [Deltaproteobacteria bacterium]|nr:M2 family metallopeptidase [Deltaproteobacteria bacterium]
MRIRGLFLIAGVFLIYACASHQASKPTVTPPTEKGAETTATQQAVSAADAMVFLERVEDELLRLWSTAERAAWVRQTYITDDTAVIAAKAHEELMAYTAKVAAEATAFDKLDLSPSVRRRLKLLKLSLTLPSPPDAKQRSELAGLATELDNIYGRGKFCDEKLAKSWKRLAKAKALPKDNCLALGQLKLIIAKSRNYDDLLAAWKGWRTIAPPMRAKFERYVELGNAGARSLGFNDLGELWKSNYDMSPEAFEAEVDRLWSQVKPLYQDLHCYTRTRLQKTYGKKNVPDGKALPAHLLGNMWSQSWENIQSILLPERSAAIDLERTFAQKKIDEQEMVRYGERFFTSLGLTKLPETFWQRSMFVKPSDREVVCHASAWDVDYESDLRIKMCIRKNGEDFNTIHHELGHNYYQYYYRQQRPLFRNSANDGFHEGLGDTISLSVTPSYLVKLGLLNRAPTNDLNTLMERALGKIAFLPFGILIDKWRWDVFSGKITPANYNKAWWDLRTRYQGIAAPVERSEQDFDPGAKFHIPANVPYTRYFLAHILQFQFHRALCKISGHEGPLHKCSIYENKAAGERLKAMMEMGMSEPWPKALEALTGEKKMDASAILAYFKPLHDWLKKQNQGQQCGW